VCPHFCFLCVVGDSRFWALLYVHHHRVSISWSMANSLNVNWGLSAGITQSKACCLPVQFFSLGVPHPLLPLPGLCAGMRDDGDVLHI
jgi:hypothetical protein